MNSMGQEVLLDVLGNDGRPGRVERKDAAENRVRILQVAERLFAERGVAAVPMAEIAKAAGVGKGTLYRRFANKGELCLALMDSQMRAFQDVMLGRMQEMGTDGVPKLAQLSNFLDGLVYFTRDHMPLLCEVQRASTDIDAGRMVRPHHWLYLTVRGLLQEAVKEDEVPAGLDTAYIAEALLAPLNASVFRLQIEVLGFSLARISAGLRTIVLGLSHNDGGRRTKDG